MVVVVVALVPVSDALVQRTSLHELASHRRGTAAETHTHTSDSLRENFLVPMHLPQLDPKSQEETVTNTF